ncbi:MAG TPA: adenylate/guanylate cyclase domain-containing protein [Vicinamibacterales bacterium]|jgi:class 3 adenylate cyclase
MTNGPTSPRFHLDVVRAGRILGSSADRLIAIGRDPQCDIPLSDPHVSLRHGEIFFTDKGAAYRDLKSRNGSAVRRGADTTRIDATVGHQFPLRDGDELRLGNPLEPIVLQIRLTREDQPAGSAPPAEHDDSPVEKHVTGYNHYADIETIRGRLGDDKRALQCLYNLLDRLTAAPDRDSMLKTVARLLFESFESATHVTVYLGPPQASTPSDLVPAARDEDLKADRFKPVLAAARSGRTGSPSPLSRVLFERITMKGEALLFEDALKSFPSSESMVIARVVSGLCVPLRDRAGIRGILQIDNRTITGAFTEVDLDLATLVGNHVALVLTTLEMYEHVVQLNRDLCDALMRIRLLDTAKDHLSRFVPEAVRQIVEKSPASPKLDMADSDATVLFLDIGGYTKLSEKLDRDTVSFLVERYFSSFIDDIYRHHGDINETAGDGLMIIFRSDEPVDHARSAVSAALDIRQRTKQINREAEGKTPPIDVNMGINTGTVLLGSRRIQGIAGARWTYTATGMVTNVCARLAAHAVQGQIMIGPETAKRVAAVTKLREVGPVQFKNVAQPLPVFEVLDQPSGPAAGPRAK